MTHSYGITSIEQRDYEDPNLRKTLYEKLLIRFTQEEVNKDDIKNKWHNLITQNKRKKQWHKALKTSSSGTSKVYRLIWTFLMRCSFWT